MELADTPSLNAGAGLQAAVDADAWIEEKHFRVILTLADGDWVELASFVDEASAEDCAGDMAAKLASGGEWPRVRGRYLRPETIVAIEISERRRLSGSNVRANYWHGVDGQKQPG